MILLYITFILFILWYLLIIFDLRLKIEFSFEEFKVYIFKIRIIKIKKEKYSKYFSKLIPKSKKEVEKDLDLTTLITLVHFQYLDIMIDKNINDYANYIYLLQILSIINYSLINLLKEHIDKYCFNIKKNEKNNIVIKTKFSFNLGLMLINYIIIKWRYRKIEKTN